MKALLSLSILFWISFLFGQDSTIYVNGQEFYTKTKTLSNEWETTDTVTYFYRVEDSKKVYLLKYYNFYDGGADCNNVFWEREAFKVEGDSIVFTTWYYQKTGADPLPEERKQIYIVDDEGKLNLVYNRYRFRDSNEWVLATCY